MIYEEEGDDQGSHTLPANGTCVETERDLLHRTCHFRTPSCYDHVVRVQWGKRRTDSLLCNPRHLVFLLPRVQLLNLLESTQKMDNSTPGGAGVLNWANNIRLNLAKGEGRQLVHDRIQDTFNFLDNYLEDVIQRPRTESVQS